MAALEEETGEDEVEYAVSTGQSDRAERKPLFKLPNIREDFRALPAMFRAKPIVLVPLVILVGGFILVLAYGGLPPEMQRWASLYIQFLFVPPSLFTFFIAGFIATRSSYLVGFLFALVLAAMWAVLILGFGFIYAAELDGVFLLPDEFRVPAALQFALMSITYGTIAAAFAGWYRDFLRGMQDRGRARRADKEVDERAKRAAERQEARKLAKQRP